MRYALIKNGKVANIIEADAEFAAGLPGFDAVVASTEAGVGWDYANGMLIAPEVPEPEPVVQLTQLAYLRRFTAPERIAITASVDPLVQDFLTLLGMAQDVRLDDADVIMGTQYLEQSGLIGAGRAAEILTPG